MAHRLASRETYEAMIAFLERHYELTKSEDVGGLLGSMRLLDDGVSADPAMGSDWQQAIETMQARNE